MNSNGSSNGNGWLSIAAKYGITGVIALYLTYFMATTINGKLDQMVDILEDIRFSLREEANIATRPAAR